MFTAHPPNSPPGRAARTSLDRPIRPIGISPRKPAPYGIESLIAAAPNTRCQNNRGLFVASVIAGVAFELTCDRWDCPAPSCGGLKKLAARELFFQGTEAAWDRGDRVRFMTLTAPAEGMTLDAVKVGWTRVAEALRRRGVLDQYAAVVELQDRGEPHLHVLFTGDYIAQPELSRIARGGSRASGRFGEVCDIRDARSTGERSLVAYMSKTPGRSKGTAAELAHYAAKAGAADRGRLYRSGGSRRRPIRTSQLWYPGGLKAAAEAVKAEWSVNLDLQPVTAEDWGVWRVRQDTGELVPLSQPVAAPEVDRRTSLAIVPEVYPELLAAA